MPRYRIAARGAIRGEGSGALDCVLWQDPLYSPYLFLMLAICLPEVNSSLCVKPAFSFVPLPNSFANFKAIAGVIERFSLEGHSFTLVEICLKLWQDSNIQ